MKKNGIFLVLTLIILMINTECLWAQNIKGLWRISCYKSVGTINILSQDSIEIDLNSNQIYILANAKQIDSKRYSLFLNQPLDLGLGGMQLVWDNYSHDLPIGELYIEQNNMLELKWLGFFNLKTKKREWLKQPNWFIESSIYPLCFKKCR